MKSIHCFVDKRETNESRKREENEWNYKIKLSKENRKKLNFFEKKWCCCCISSKVLVWKVGIFCCPFPIECEFQTFYTKEKRRQFRNYFVYSGQWFAMNATQFNFELLNFIWWKNSIQILWKHSFLHFFSHFCWTIIGCVQYYFNINDCGFKCNFFLLKPQINHKFLFIPSSDNVY